MRNVFDQYSQPENRVTHALMSALNEDRKLLAAFLKDIVRHVPTKKSDLLDISEQSYPGEVGSGGIDENENGGRRIPDAWITAGEKWCLIIENKVISPPDAAQLRGHLATARRLGFDAPKGLLLTIKQPSGKLPDEVDVVEWRSVYKWLQRQTSRSEWAERVAAYLEVMEARMIEHEQIESGTLTAFSGFRFGESDAFHYLKGKRVLRLAMDELRKRTDLSGKIGVAQEFSGRKAIRGRKSGEVWDFLAFVPNAKGENFTAHPHLTLGVGGDSVSAMVTLPNNAGSARRRLMAHGEQGFPRHGEQNPGEYAPTLVRSVPAWNRACVYGSGIGSIGRPRRYSMRLSTSISVHTPMKMVDQSFSPNGSMPSSPLLRTKNPTSNYKSARSFLTEPAKRFSGPTPSTM